MFTKFISMLSKRLNKYETLQLIFPFCGAICHHNVNFVIANFTTKSEIFIHFLKRSGSVLIHFMFFMNLQKNLAKSIT